MTDTRDLYVLDNWTVTFANPLHISSMEIRIGNSRVYISHLNGCVVLIDVDDEFINTRCIFSNCSVYREAVYIMPSKRHLYLTCNQLLEPYSGLPGAMCSAFNDSPETTKLHYVYWLYHHG